MDNGQLWFDHVRVPRDALLDAFASVGEDGAYSSAIPSVSQRFGTMVGGLTTGARALAASSSHGIHLGVHREDTWTAGLHVGQELAAAWCIEMPHMEDAISTMECLLHVMGHRAMQRVPPALEAVSTVLTK